MKGKRNDGKNVTRMTKLIKTKLKNQMNINKYRVTANITQYNNISKFIKKRQLFHV